MIYKINQNEINAFQILKEIPSQEKLHKFLKYFLNEKNILTWMKDAWSSHFENEFVENQLINPLIRYFCTVLVSHVTKNRRLSRVKLFALKMAY